MLLPSASTIHKPKLTCLGGEFATPARLPGGRDRLIVIDSLSKSFGMTGWRLGYLVLPPGLAKTVLKFIQHSIYCVPNFVQHAGITALSLADELVPAYWAMFRGRLATAAERLSSDRRIPDRQSLQQEVAAWLRQRNANHAKADWRFTTEDARIKLKRVYPAF